MKLHPNPFSRQMANHDNYNQSSIKYSSKYSLHIPTLLRWSQYNRQPHKQAFLQIMYMHIFLPVELESYHKVLYENTCTITCTIF